MMYCNLRFEISFDISIRYFIFVKVLSCCNMRVCSHTFQLLSKPSPKNIMRNYDRLVHLPRSFLHGESRDRMLNRPRNVARIDINIRGINPMPL